LDFAADLPHFDFVDVVLGLDFVEVLIDGGLCLKFLLLLVFERMAIVRVPFVPNLLLRRVSLHFSKPLYY
jgi:hypothetical protein